MKLVILDHRYTVLRVKGMPTIQKHVTTSAELEFTKLSEFTNIYYHLKSVWESICILIIITQQPHV